MLANIICTVCESGFYGDGCNQTCTCANGGACDPVHGLCTCPSGFYGDSCKQGMQSYLYHIFKKLMSFHIYKNIYIKIFSKSIRYKTRMHNTHSA